MTLRDAIEWAVVLAVMIPVSILFFAFFVLPYLLIPLGFFPG